MVAGGHACGGALPGGRHALPGQGGSTRIATPHIHINTGLCHTVCMRTRSGNTKLFTVRCNHQVIGFNERDGAILSYRLLYDDGEEEKAVRRHLIRVADQEVRRQTVHLFRRHTIPPPQTVIEREVRYCHKVWLFLDCIRVCHRHHTSSVRLHQALVSGHSPLSSPWLTDLPSPVSRTRRSASTASWTRWRRHTRRTRPG
jgi:hypothetical protein